MGQKLLQELQVLRHLMLPERRRREDNLTHTFREFLRIDGCPPVQAVGSNEAVCYRNAQLEPRDRPLQYLDRTTAWFPRQDDNLIAILPAGFRPSVNFEEFCEGDLVSRHSGMHPKDNRGPGVGEAGET